jgi:hypothetical protein
MFLKMVMAKITAAELYFVLAVNGLNARVVKFIR